MKNDNESLVDLGDANIETRGPLAVGIPDQFQGASLPGLALADD